MAPSRRREGEAAPRVSGELDPGDVPDASDAPGAGGAPEVAAARPDTVEVRDARALRALAHPTRMRLLGVLRLQGPLTATQAARLLGETPQRCTFHLRQLAKYGLAQEAGGGRGRERPWRATALFTDIPNVLEGVDASAAAGLLEAALVDQHFRLIREWMARKPSEPRPWQEAASFGDMALYLTPDEVAELRRRTRDIRQPFVDRLRRLGLRPEGSRLVMLIDYAVPLTLGGTERT